MKTEQNNTEWIAIAIMICAVIASSPRWVGALMASEGFAIPSNWLDWWIPLSAIMDGSMAIVEGASFSYVFYSWRTQKNSNVARNLLFLTVFSALVFVVVLAPYIACSVRQVTLGELLTNDLALYAWSVCVALSTIAIVGSVGYAQRPSVVITQKLVQPPVTAITEQPKTQVGAVVTQPKVQVVKPMNKNKTKIYEILTANPETKTKELSTILGISGTAVRNYWNELITEGKLPKKHD